MLFVLCYSSYLLLRNISEKLIIILAVIFLEELVECIASLQDCQFPLVLARIIYNTRGETYFSCFLPFEVKSNPLGCRRIFAQKFLQRECFLPHNVIREQVLIVASNREIFLAFKIPIGGGRAELTQRDDKCLVPLWSTASILDHSRLVLTPCLCRYTHERIHFPEFFGVSDEVTLDYANLQCLTIAA